MNIRVRAPVMLAALMIVSAAGAQIYNPAVVYCKATILSAGGSNGTTNYLSITLPETPGAVDQEGNPVTIWNIGDVVAGGVADSWHGEGGPGRFVARNTGNVPAYVYVTTGVDGFSELFDQNGVPLSGDDSGWYWERLRYLFGEGRVALIPRPTIRLDARITDGEYQAHSYHLALTTDVTAKAPTWRSLDRLALNGYEWVDSTTEASYGLWDAVCAAYLAYMPVGEYQPFDLKFYAPQNRYYNQYTYRWEEADLTGRAASFVFRVEASAFPRWEHDR